MWQWQQGRRRDESVPRLYLSRLSCCTVLVLSFCPHVALGGIPPHTISGVSAGGDMTVNHLVAFSRSVTGAGVVAGAPYGCNLIGGGRHDRCGSMPPAQGWDQPLQKMRRRIRRRQSRGLIDPIWNLRNTSIFLYSGQYDRVVTRGVMKALRQQLRKLVRAPGAIVSEFNVPSAHGWVVDGSQCARHSTSCSECCCAPAPLLNCHGYDLAGQLLGHVLGRPLGERASRTSPLLRVSQASYLPVGYSLKSAGMWHTAFVYAPWRCRYAGAGCDIHVHYHGCVWGAEYLGRDYFRALGINEWAETADIIVLFPQASSTVDTGGCWDWTGETGGFFDTKYGVQLQTVINMVSDLERIVLPLSGNETIQI